MGIVKHGDKFSRRHMTAIVLGEGGRAWAVPIRRTVGQYFIAKISKMYYAFSLQDAHIYTFDDRGALSARFVIYDVSHFQSIQPWYGELRELMEEMGVTLTTNVFAGILRGLRDREPHKIDENWKGHDLAAYLERASGAAQSNPEAYAELQRFITGLPKKNIVRPIAKLSELIDRHGYLASSSFLGQAYTQSVQAGLDLKTLANPSKGAGNSYMMLGMVVVLIAAMGGGLFYAYEEGLIPGTGDGGFAGISLGPLTDGPGGGDDPCTDEAILERYATPVDLRIAVEDGIEACELSTTLQNTIDGISQRIVDFRRDATAAITP